VLKWLLQASKEHANARYLVPHNWGLGNLDKDKVDKALHSPIKWSTVSSSSWYRELTASVQICIRVGCWFKSAWPVSRPVSILISAKHTQSFEIWVLKHYRFGYFPTLGIRTWWSRFDKVLGFWHARFYLTFAHHCKHRHVDYTDDFASVLSWMKDS